MSSPVQINDTPGWIADLRMKAASARQPMAASLELTQRCNLRCRHCYLGSRTQEGDPVRPERGAAAWRETIEEWVDAGVLFLLFTGGDPMIRPDFPQLYRHAVELGLVVNVFCNGTLVTDRILELFREYPPRKVEISVYGATAPTYERVTGVAGSYDRAWRGICRLKAAGLRVDLKTMLLTLNQHELGEMAAQAEEIGSNFRFDAAVTPCLADGKTDPLAYRVAPEVAVERDLALPGRRERWARNIQKHQDRLAGDALYNCGAGLTSFHVDPYGAYYPCVMTSNYCYAGAGRRFDDIWHSDLGAIRERKRTRPDGVLTGPLRGACTHCPAANFVESGDEEIDPEYLEKTARLRYDAVMKEAE